MLKLPTLADAPRRATQKHTEPTRKQRKAKQKRERSQFIKAVRAEVMERDGYICRCCGWRAADSMHEIVPRSLGGKVSLENSIALCGSGTTGCHGFIQQHKIDMVKSVITGEWDFIPKSPKAEEWMDILQWEP